MSYNYDMIPCNTAVTRVMRKHTNTPPLTKCSRCFLDNVESANANSAERSVYEKSRRNVFKAPQGTTRCFRSHHFRCVCPPKPTSRHLKAPQCTSRHLKAPQGMLSRIPAPKFIPGVCYSITLTLTLTLQ